MTPDNPDCSEARQAALCAVQESTLVALRASVTRSFFSWTSTSLAPPTLITAMPPLSFASRSCSFSLQQPGTCQESLALCSTVFLAACGLSACPGCILSNWAHHPQITHLPLDHLTALNILLLTPVQYRDVPTTLQSPLLCTPLPSALCAHLS